MLNVSIGIPAFNEEKNIGLLLENLLRQELKKVKIGEIIVISSGSTDKTNEIVKNWQKKDCRVKLIVEEKRRGKTIADNLFFKKAKEKILVLLCADTLPQSNCLEKLIEPFISPEIGVTAARMAPLNKKNNLSGFLFCNFRKCINKVSQQRMKNSMKTGNWALHTANQFRKKNFATRQSSNNFCVNSIQEFAFK